MATYVLIYRFSGVCLDDRSQLKKLIQTVGWQLLNKPLLFGRTAYSLELTLQGQIELVPFRALLPDVIHEAKIDLASP